MEDRAVLFNFDAFLADPKGLILVFLLALPGRRRMRRCGSG